MPELNAQNINQVAYEIKGAGHSTLVLLRGLGRWSAHWLGFEDRLVAQGYRVISIDNRGFGNSARLPIESGSRITNFAEDVASVIAKEAPQGAHVIGVSLGGMIALALASGRPQLVKSLTIINSSLASSHKKRLTLKGASAVTQVALGFQSGYPKLAKVLLSQAASPELTGQLASKWSAIDVVTSTDVKSVLKQLRAARCFAGLAESAAIKCPVQIIKSAGDLFIDPANSDYIHRQIKGSQLVTHPSAGHELAFEDPNWLSTKITDFVASASAG